MSAYNLPDYRAKYFEYKDLSKMYRQPTIDSIVTLMKQGKRNAQSVKLYWAEVNYATYGSS